MTEPRRTARQDYILRVRYQNTLPAPPFDPVLLKLPTSIDSFKEPSFLNDLIHEQPPKMEIDSELGMPLDLSIVPGIFEGDYTAMFPEADVIELDPKDKILTRSITDNTTGKLTGDVAFLRRTQYISSEIALTTKMKAQESSKQAQLKASVKVELDPEEQLKAIETTFEAMKSSISSLSHPTKRDLRPVCSWDVVPDLEHAEQQYVHAKFPSNPAPRSKSNAVSEDEDTRLEVACLVPRIVDETNTTVDNDYIAYFLPDAQSAEEIIKSNHQPDPSHHVPQQYKFVREYDAKKEDGGSEWAISLRDGKAFYVELGGRMNMRGRRRGAQVTNPHEIVEISMRSADDTVAYADSPESHVEEI